MRLLLQTEHNNNNHDNNNNNDDDDNRNRYTYLYAQERFWLHQYWDVKASRAAGAADQTFPLVGGSQDPDTGLVTCVRRRRVAWCSRFHHVACNGTNNSASSPEE